MPTASWPVAHSTVLEQGHEQQRTLDRGGGYPFVKQNEEQFHDQWAASINPAEVMVDESWDAVTCPEHRWIRANWATCAAAVYLI